MNANRSPNMPWKILNKPEKLFSEVTVRQMTPEERQKYGEPTKNTKIKLGVDEYMKKLNITTEQLLEDCREHGTSWGAAKVIAEKHGMTRNQIYNLIKNRKIREKLTEEHKKEEEKPKINEEKSEEAKEAVKIMGGASELIMMEVKETESNTKTRLRPKALESQSCPLEYMLFDEYLEIRADGAFLRIWWSDLEDFIKDLKELQQMEIADEEKGIAMGANNDSVCRICGRENCDRG